MWVQWVGVGEVGGWKKGWMWMKWVGKICGWVWVKWVGEVGG